MGLEYLNRDEIMESKNKIAHELSLSTNYYNRTGEIFNYISSNFSANAEILEMGCGAGSLAKQLLEKGFKNLKLIDIDDYLAAELKGKVELKLLDLNFGQLPYDDNRFDAVLAIAIMEHLENPYIVIRESARVLKASGKFLVAIPYIHSLMSKLKFFMSGNLAGYTETNNHITLFTNAVFNKVFLKDFTLISKKVSDGYLRIFDRKIRLKNIGWFNKLFGDKILYIFEKK